METDPNETASFRMMVELEDRDLLQASFQTPLIETLAWDATTGKLVAANDAALAAIGLSLRELPRTEIATVLHGLSAPRINGFLARVKSRKNSCLTFRFNHHDRNGQLRRSRTLLRYQHEPRPTFVAHTQDISRYVAARTAALAAEETLTTAIDSLPDGFVLYDANDRLVICNDRYRKIYAASAPAMKKGATFREILQYGLDHGQYADGIGREEDWLAERLEAHKNLGDTVEQPLTNGQWLRIVERPTTDGGRVGLRIDITELKNHQALLEQNARTDHLTGLMNRRGLSDRLLALKQNSDPSLQIAVLHVDLDKFKAINDAQGHAAGDFVLRHCADILTAFSKDSQMVARVGGDEFIVLLPIVQNLCAQAQASKLIRKLAAPISFQNRICNFGASIGISIFDPSSTDDIDGALTDADIALNVAKQTGRGVARVFEAEMRHDIVRQIQMGQLIRVGLQADQFEPFFQPQVDVQSRKIVGFESLIRWQHPERGLVPAFEFLPAAARAGLMDQLDHVVMQRSCSAIAQMIEWGVPNPRVSVNMSMAQLRDPQIGDQIQKYVHQFGVKPENLRIELLESTLLDERSSVIVNNVHHLIGLGFAVELDDFGTGHAAIATLRKFDVSRIKIDRSLVQDIDTDAELQEITGAIINLADRLDIKVLAEGVETESEQATLQTLGCHCAQGYLHARPMPLSQILPWIDGWTSARPT